jgi:colanic acid/amylovoran biosynthesis glycosyltransferase
MMSSSRKTQALPSAASIAARRVQRRRLADLLQLQQAQPVGDLRRLHRCLGAFRRPVGGDDHLEAGGVQGLLPERPQTAFEQLAPVMGRDQDAERGRGAHHRLAGIYIAVSPAVLHAVTGFGYASETFIYDRMRELDRLGWEAWVGAKWIVGDPLFDFPAPDRIISPRPRDNLMRRLNPVAAGRKWWWLQRPIRKSGPALIHAHFGWTAIEAVPAAERHGIPLVAGFHGYDATVFPHYGMDADGAGEPTMPPGVYDEVFEKAACIFATSNFIAATLRELGCPQDPVVVPSGIRLEYFPYRGPRGRDEEEELRIVFVGRLVPSKGLDVAIEAIAEIGDDAPITLEIIGEGPMRAECEALAHSLGLEECVRFRGRQPREAVLAALEQADVLVMPSRITATGQAEGLGNVIKEALAVGLEVAATDNGGIPEAFPPERRGELVQEGDAIALAARLMEIRRARADWPERSLAGRRWVEEACDWKVVALKLDAAYRRVMGASPRPSEPAMSSNST